MAKAMLTIADYRKAARKVLPRMAWDYFRSGSDGQTLLKRNREAWDAMLALAESGIVQLMELQRACLSA